MPVADQVSLGGAGIDLIGRGNVWVEDSVLDGASQAVAQALIALALGGTTPGQLEVIVLDYCIVHAGTRAQRSGTQSSQRSRQKLSAARARTTAIFHVLRIYALYLSRDRNIPTQLWRSAGHE